MADNVLVAFISAIGIGLFVGAFKLIKLLANRAEKKEEIENGNLKTTPEKWIRELM